jgi:hypothetical protein
MAGAVGAATTVLDAVPAGPAVPAALVTTQLTVSVPGAPAVKVTLVLVLVPPAVMLPPLTVQA